MMTKDLTLLFGDTLQANVPIAPYTTARIGGTADALLIVRAKEELAAVLTTCWQNNIPFRLLGGGSNVLVSDNGIRELVILNKAKSFQILPTPDGAIARADSGVMISNFAHKLGAAGLTGFEWAATIPGTIGGAVYGNAGAYGGDINDSLHTAAILTPGGEQTLTASQMGYDYRSSILKRGELYGVILEAEFFLKNGDSDQIKNKIEMLTTKRKNSQPPGASMGSMFKNPAGDYAGRLIEACGLKGTKIGNAEISTVHGNFIVNNGNTSALDVKSLIELVKTTVYDKFGIELHLEVELIGDWK
jgi:UDP-N-acetylmuramate dehydrogenase